MPRQCRYYSAWCQYRLGRLETAARAFPEAVTALKGSLPDVAVQSAWMQCVALQQFAVKDKKQIGPAMTAMQTLIADFPKSEQAGKAEFALTRLRQASASPRKRSRELAAVKPEDPTTSLRNTKSASSATSFGRRPRASQNGPPRLAAELLAAVDRLLAVAQQSDHERRLRAALPGRRCARA